MSAYSLPEEIIFAVRENTEVSIKTISKLRSSHCLVTGLYADINDFRRVYRRFSTQAFGRVLRVRPASASARRSRLPHLLTQALAL